jgi:hypothetical protein
LALAKYAVAGPVTPSDRYTPHLSVTKLARKVAAAYRVTPRGSAVRQSRVLFMFPRARRVPFVGTENQDPAVTCVVAAEKRQHEGAHQHHLAIAVGDNQVIADH